MKKLLLVDKNDKIIGYDTKENCHKGKGKLHRCFSTFIFNSKEELLIQQRSQSKPLWPMFWSNSACSHPRKSEEMIKAGEKRLLEELGFTCKLKEIGKFIYEAEFRKIGSEHEVDHMLTGGYDGKINPDKKEVSDYKWISLPDLKKDMKKNPEKYTPWFKVAIKFFKNK